MKKREKAQFIFEPDYYCGKHGCPPRVPADTPVLFEIEVISFIEASAYDAFEVTPEEQRKKLTLDQILQICNCLREVILNTRLTNNICSSSCFFSIPSHQ